MDPVGRTTIRIEKIQVMLVNTVNNYKVKSRSAWKFVSEDG